MAGLISLAFFAMLTTVITWYGYRRYVRPGRIFDHVGRPVLVSEDTYEPANGGPRLLVRKVQQIGEKVPISPRDASRTRRLLMAAGYRADSAVPTYYGIKVLLGVAFLLLALLVRGSLPFIAPMQIALVMGAGALGFFIPNIVLDQMISARQERLKYALPDALDLMVVSVEAGLGLDQALNNVAQELAISHPELAEEFGLVSLEMRAGKRRADALHNLAERTGVREIRHFVAMLVQTDRFGTSLAESLRTHSDFMRIQRRQEAEERANKVGVKLVFPIFFCILPSMFIVVGGPAMLQIFKQLLPLIRQSVGLQ